MGGCCCSSRKPLLHGTPVYYYYPPALEENESLTPHEGSASALAARFLVNLHLEVPDTFRPPPAPLPYDVVSGCPQSTDSEPFIETLSRGSLETLGTCEDLEESGCKTQSGLLFSPRKPEVSKLTKSKESTTEEEDACPICLEEYDTENPKLITKCEHHYHLSCVLEWMERSDTCPMCDQEMIFDQTFDQ
ncbi:Detected protein of confused Function [Hibiscus syriacus]|uniref:RING-type E3 ubiquitin transferase n=1 Tax=Hibiscus syriacus TaxID=106335 RepID=A0A6A2WLK8_HIBSY|nr:probable E3 ubiquitin-protein ligase RHB1A [Hibiscus syriacus]XP_039048432.1 probable E3 ubiquitin-protein ligase RHB1A [Hibiscus syriacus]XP_039048433.1 probable E3 ubiquitin-protein ligase RHB1A [Hibiscus syriacus]KAE8660478.1 Detected protein of confused Function [Hibiscus syriacus]